MQLADKLKEYSSYSGHPSKASSLASSLSQIDMAVMALSEAASHFTKLPLEQKIALAKSMQRGYMRIAEQSVFAGCKAKGIDIGSTSEAEEWATGPWGIVRQLRLIGESLKSIQKSGNTSIGKVSRNVAGNLSVKVFPNNAIDGMLFKSNTVEVHMLPHVTQNTLEADRASFYKKPKHPGQVVAVLGAGNIAAIGVMDVITKMFNEGKVCILKMNPVNAYLGPFIEEAFKEAINHHYLAIIYGGVEEGHYLVNHPHVHEVHLTGSHKTHDRIVWGPTGEDKTDRILRNEPRLKKAITSELGNISPVIIVPGPYTAKEIAFQAEAIASAMTMNASFFCNAAKMLITPKGWDGSHQFLQAIQEVCAKVEPRQAYYPGASDRWHELTEHRKNIKHIGSPKAGALPWTFITGLDPDDANEVLFQEEPFCSVLSEVQLGSEDPVVFLEQAVEFCNNKLWGTLNATIVVHPKILKNPKLNAPFERAISKLRYGTIAINTFPGVSFVYASAPWGAYPDAKLSDIQSGSGFVHNTAMLEGIEKVVIRAPLTVFPKPAFLPLHRTAQSVMRGICEMEENASWAKVPKIVWAAMLG